MTGKLLGTGTAWPDGNERRRNCVGDRQSAGTYWTQTARETEQQTEQKLGGGRGQGQQEAEVLKILYTNAQSILGKLNELSAQAVDTKPDFILLTETWCNPTITSADLTLPGYQLELELREDREDTANGIGGGLLVYSKNGHKILPTTIKSEFHQYVSFKIITTENPLNIVLIYRPPSSGKENVQKLCQILKNLPKNSIVIGDINLPHID